MADESRRIERELSEALRRGGVDRLSAAGGGGRPATGRFDPRPSSPLQVALVGGALLLARWLGLYALLGLGPLAAPLGTLGLALLFLAGLSWLLRPPRRAMYWRGRRLELEPSSRWHHRVYRALYRNAA